MAAQQSSEQKRRIVVGVDGSESSKAALGWAVRQARLTGAVVEAVTAWEFPIAYGYPAPILDVNFEDLAAQTLTHAIAEVTAGEDDAGSIQRKVINGHAAKVLIDESVGADLLVVGSRGHGGFVEALLGSTGQHAVHHSACPVVVIRGPATGPHQR